MWRPCESYDVFGRCPVSRWFSYAAAAGGSLVLLVWYTNDLTVTLWTLVSIVGICLVFGLLAWGLLKGGRVAGMQLEERLALGASRFACRR